MLRKGIRLFLLVLFLFLPFTALGEGVSRALLIGADRFVTMPETTPAAERNLGRMEAMLWARMPGLADCRTTLNGPASEESLSLLMLETFADADEGDLSLIYFSTHGILTDGRAAILLSDGTKEEALEPETLYDILTRIPGRKILILDACYSGGFIGKGMPDGSNVFAGSGIRVLACAGGLEQSALWLEDSGGAGGSWFLSALEALVSGGAGPGDADGDGFFSLKELTAGVRALCGDSRAYCYPEDDAEALFSVGETEEGRAVSGLQFSEAESDPARPKVDFTFTAGTAIRLRYRMVYWKDGGWDFTGAVQMADRERWEGTRGLLGPGEKQRTVRLATVDGESSGFALLQILNLQDGAPVPEGSRRIALTGETEAELLVISGAETFRPDAGEELNALIGASAPCRITVTVESENGEIVRTLIEGEACQPGTATGTEEAAGLWACWSGLDDAGQRCPAGAYRIHAVCTDGLGGQEAFSAFFTLEEQENGEPE
jgi:hypothetical protein